MPQDGLFSPGLKVATQAWQKAHGLDPDGVVGPATWGAATSGTGSTALATMTPTTSGEGLSAKLAPYVDKVKALPTPAKVGLGAGIAAILLFLLGRNSKKRK